MREGWKEYSASHFFQMDSAEESARQIFISVRKENFSMLLIGEMPMIFPYLELMRMES